MGNVMGKVRKNFYIGVRVPWTLASDRVWNDTHRLAAWVCVAAGVIGFAMIVLGVPILGPIVVLILSAFVPVIYSFVHYKSLERRGALYEPSSVTLIDPFRDLIGAGLGRGSSRRTCRLRSVAYAVLVMRRRIADEAP